MKRFIYLFILLVIVSSCGKITVMTYNIHAMRGMDKKLDAVRIAKVINEQDPDLVALQEVDMFTERSGKMDAMFILEKETGMKGVFMRTFDYQGGEFGNAVLSKFPIVDQKLIPLPSREEYEPRLLMRIRVLLDNGDTLSFYNTHLDHHRQDSDRPLQMQRIVDVIKEDKYKTVFLGDLNCQPGSEPIEMINEILTRCSSDDMTYPADEPYWIIDHIYYSAEKGIKNLGLDVIPEKIASDHRPLIAKFRMNAIGQ